MTPNTAAELATQALHKLLRAADKHAAGTTSRPPALSGKALADYRQLPRLEDKETYDAIMKEAQAQGAITLHSANKHKRRKSAPQQRCLPPTSPRIPSCTTSSPPGKNCRTCDKPHRKTPRAGTTPAKP